MHTAARSVRGTNYAANSQGMWAFPGAVRDFDYMNIIYIVYCVYCVIVIKCN